MPLFSPPVVGVRDEGASQGFVPTLDFVGAGVTAVVSGSVATITVSGGAGTFAVTTVEVNLGSTPAWRGKFTVTDAAITSTSKIIIQQAPGPYTGKGTRADEAEMDPLWCVATPGTGNFVVHWRTMAGVVTTYADVRGLQPVSSDNTQHGEAFRAALIHRVAGLVKGNVKFNYTIA